MGKVEELEARVAFLEEVLENVPVGVILLDPKGKVLAMNAWQENTSRIRREQVLGDYFHERWERLFQQGFMKDYWKLLENGTPYQSIVHDVYPQFYDQKISALSRGAALPGGRGFILLHDVLPEIQRDKRGLERLTRQLDESRNFLANLIDSSPNAVVTATVEGRIRSVNRTGEDLFGISRSELAGRPLESLLAQPHDLERYVSLARGGGPVEVWCQNGEGRSFPARMQLRDIKGRDGDVQAKLYLFTDVTREKAMEEKLALSEKLAIYSELMAGIAHQLNNPLVGVANFAALLADRIGSDDPNQELVRTIVEAAETCRNMLRTMIKSLREPESTFHAVDLGAVLAGALEAARREEAAAAALVEVSEERDSSPLTVRGDSLQLLEVFRNILVNAFQAMPRGGRLTLRTRADEAAGEVGVVVGDTGPGIAEENLTRIFDPFFTTKKNTGGGLGLSFAYRVIKSHSGRITVQPARPHGAVFRVTLPAAPKEG